MAEEQLELTDDGERALQEAQNFCWRANIAIVTAEHVLAGALVVLSGPDLPGRQELVDALVGAQGLGESGLANNVMFGSAARDALTATAKSVREAGGVAIDARRLAQGIIESDEVNPAFFAALGRSKTDVLAALRGS